MARPASLSNYNNAERAITAALQPAQTIGVPADNTFVKLQPR
jgi:hypothetical protein